MNQRLLEEALEGLVPEVSYLEETGSTNTVAKAWAAQGAPEGALVVAGFQTAGRGRFQRAWFAPPGCCLLFSQVLRPKCDPEEFPLLNLAASIGLAAAISVIGLPFGLQPGLKWPNDVLIGGRKVAGILSEVVNLNGPLGAVEATREPSQAAVVGIGINVNVDEFPTDLRPTATSLSLEAGSNFDLVELLAQFLRSFQDVLGSFPGGVSKMYEGLSETIGKHVRVQAGDLAFEGKAVRIDPLGRLVLDGGQTVASGDLTYGS